jgi:hypothetical protein
VQAEETAKKKDAMQEQLRQKAVQKEVTNAECTGDLCTYFTNGLGDTHGSIVCSGCLCGTVRTLAYVSVHLVQYVHLHMY